jgi:PAS domain S-box-containing protein
MSDSTRVLDGTLVAEASMDGVGVVREGKYDWVTDRLAEIHGYDAAGEIVGRAWSACYVPDTPDGGSTDALQRVRAEGEWRGRLLARTRGGDEVPVEVSMRDAPEGVVCVVRESTERPGTDRYEAIVETVEDGVYSLDEDLRFDFVNDAICEMVGTSRADLIGTNVMDLFGFEDEMALAAEVRQRVLAGDGDTGTIEGTYERDDGEMLSLEARFRLRPSPNDEFAGSVGVVRDVTERIERERRLERRRDELDTLNRINRLLLEILQELFESPSIRDIEQTVCERLADSEFYEFAWLGGPGARGDRLLPRASAGLDDEFVSSISVLIDDVAGDEPGALAFRTGEVQVGRSVGTARNAERWRRVTTEHGVEAAAAVPLVNEDTVLGILTVYTSRPQGFSPLEQYSFEILGEAIGFVLHARRTMQLLYTETVSQLDFELRGTETAVGPSADLDCSVCLDGYVATSEGDWLLYLTVTGPDSRQFVAVGDDDDRVRAVETLEHDETGLLVGLVVESPLLDTVAALGGKIVDGGFDAQTCRFTVEVPQSTDVRRLLSQIRATYPKATLVSQTNHERSVDDSLWLSDDRRPDLTERQRQALEAAYRAGYFEWPRESTAQDVADLLGIAGSTFHAHLRKAEGELLSAFFETVESNDRDR